MAFGKAAFRQGLAAQRLRIIEGGALKIARGQHAEPIEDREIGDRADRAVLVRERAQAPAPQGIRGEHDPVGVVNAGISIAAHGDRLEILRSHHRAGPAAARVPTFIADRGEADTIFAGRADRRDSDRGGAQLRSDGRFGFLRALPA
jgi:hypothetical protein